MVPSSETPRYNTRVGDSDSKRRRSAVPADSRVQLGWKADIALWHLLLWCGGQKLQISTMKTTYTLLKGHMQRNAILKLDGRAIRRKSTTRYLGIHVGERENYAEHIQQMCNKATRHNAQDCKAGQKRIPHTALQVVAAVLLMELEVVMVAAEY
ncbi:hypothetical protein Trydic_g15409 [Trypoxylus dichotomus]